MNKTALTLCSLIAVCTLLADQLVKLTFSLEKTILNPGISFGFFSGPLLTLLLLGILIAVVVFLTRHRAPAIPTGLLVGAASSNLLDRLVFGGVRDIFALPVINVYNNLADWAIVIAVVWLFIWQSRTLPPYESHRL